MCLVGLDRTARGRHWERGPGRLHVGGRQGRGWNLEVDRDKESRRHLGPVSGTPGWLAVGEGL